MNLAKRLSSRNVLVFNLVLIGVVFGFSMAFASFSCAAPGSRPIVMAQEPRPLVIPENAFDAAYGLQVTFNAIADRVLPSVVLLQTTAPARRNAPILDFDFDGFPGFPFFDMIIPRGRGQQQQPEPRQQQGLGSGIIVRGHGDVFYVLTNDHVIDNATEIVIVTMDGGEYAAEVVGRDPRRDLAMVSFRSGEEHPIAALGDSDRVRVGDWAIAMGNPLGHHFSVTMGIVSAVGRTGGPGGIVNEFIQTDAPINRGNSGGALVNIRGEVIGIPTWIASGASGGSVGLGFAIPINNVMRSIDEFISSGEVTSGWLGVSLMEPTRDLAENLGVHGMHGALAAQVFIGSPADEGGISPGDFITGVNGRETRGVTQLQMAVGDLRPGDEAVFSLVRDGEPMEVTVRIAARTDESGADDGSLWPGAVLVGDSAGPRVVAVVRGSPADVIGLREDDVVTSVNGEPVTDMRSYFRALRRGAAGDFAIGLTRGGAHLELTHRR